MKPNSLSATALNVAMGCMARFEAEYMARGKGLSGSAATLGTTCHAALESYVQLVYVKGEREGSLKLLLEMLDLAFLSVMGSCDRKSTAYKDAAKWMKAWFERDTINASSRTVISCEQRKQFTIKASGVEIPFTYIIDRLDQTGTDEITVVDYKTNVWNVTTEELRVKIQPRAYALAIQLEHPEVERIWVEFDMLRHSGPVGTLFTKEDNRQTLREFRNIITRILNTPLNEPERHERLNSECRFCVRKSVCKALARNAAVGGTLGMELSDKLDLRDQMQMQAAALQAAISELDNEIIIDARENEWHEGETQVTDYGIKASNRRAVDADRVEMVLGPELMRRHGSTSITLAEVDALLKGNELTDEQKRDLRSLIYNKRGDLKVWTKARSPLAGL